MAVRQGARGSAREKPLIPKQAAILEHYLGRIALSLETITAISLAPPATSIAKLAHERLADMRELHRVRDYEAAVLEQVRAQDDRDSDRSHDRLVAVADHMRELVARDQTRAASASSSAVRPDGLPNKNTDDAPGSGCSGARSSTKTAVTP